MALPLEDYELIRQLKYRYCRCIDTANLDELRELFTEDASVCYVGGSYRFQVNSPFLTPGLQNLFRALDQTETSAATRVELFLIGV